VPDHRPCPTSPKARKPSLARSLTQRFGTGLLHALPRGEAIAHVLRLGIRVVELDCWPGQSIRSPRRFDEIYVDHGGAATDETTFGALPPPRACAPSSPPLHTQLLALVPCLCALCACTSPH
jgi:hypothetical protein